jgi:hypothetical protein
MLFQEQPHKITADKPGAAGDENVLHEDSFRFVVGIGILGYWVVDIGYWIIGSINYPISTNPIPNIY